ncbi:MAG: flagellar basal-body rod protein FlgC [Rhodothalassiaceae bacterium]|nr:MAG: flagellar basal-body rod protein FlgC [Rhodothalassiaceae bacterium]
MDMELQKAMAVSVAGLKAQSLRMRVIAENIANQDSEATAPGVDPYRRKRIIFKNELDRALGVEKVTVQKVVVDQKPFQRRYDPGHPGAGPDGFVTVTNVEGMIETMDLQQAQRSYQANLNAIEAAKAMMRRTLDLLR